MKWGAPAIHAAIAIVFVAILANGGCGLVGAIINAVLWFAREMAQDIDKGRAWPFIWPMRSSAQKWAEAGVPAAAGFVVWLLFSVLRLS